MRSKIKQIAIFASGAGSNAKKIIEHFKIKKDKASVALIICSNANAGVLKIATSENIKVLIIEKNKFEEDGYLSEVIKNKINLIVLAGFLWKIPHVLIQSYQNKIINIHPALLPKYGGKGMYGDRVHEAVIKSKEKESGITIHYVDEIYDHGKILFQAKCKIDENETAESLATKIHLLEHQHYPLIIEKLLTD